MKAKAVFLFLLISLATGRLFAKPPATDGGKLIFTSRCAGCHNVNRVVTGPALAGVNERRPMDWIIKFVHFSQSVIKSGDPYAAALYEKFNKIPMPDHPDLTADDIRDLVEYIKSSALAPDVKQAASFRPDKIHPAYQPLSIHNYLFLSAYLALIIILIGALLALVEVKGIQRDKQRDDDLDGGNASSPVRRS